MRLKKAEREQFMTLQLTDNATLRMKRAQTQAAVMKESIPASGEVQRNLAHEERSELIVCMKPIPPEGYASLGQLFTSTDRPPDVRTIHCVPSSWVIKSTRPPRKVWDDTGAGGGKAGSMWIVNNMNMVIIILAMIHLNLLNAWNLPTKDYTPII